MVQHHFHLPEIKAKVQITSNLKFMKKSVILLSIILMSGATTNLFAQKDRKLTKGFSINLVTGIPSAQYGVSKSDNIDAEYQLGSIWGLQLGNRWYFNPTEQYGIGLMVNWIDITAGVKAGSESSYDWARAVVDFSFCEIGPVGTYVLTKDIALDAYYNLRPTGFSSGMVWSPTSGDDDETYVYAGFGFTHALGAAFRYKALNIGLEYVMGGIKSEGTYSGPDGDEDLESQKNIANNFRIMIGAKF
jgi:hypothetical protein